MGASASTIGLGMQAAGAIGSAYSAYSKSKNEAYGYEYQAAIARNNAQLAEWQAQDALERGQTSENNVRMRGAQVKGTQTAIIAGRNVAINEGSAMHVLADTSFMTERDALTTRDNAAREAWALRNQAGNYRSNAELLNYRADSQSPLSDAAGSLLTSGGKVAQNWYILKEKSGNANGSKAYSSIFYNTDGRDY